MSSKQEQLAELLEARAQCQEKRVAYNAAKGELRAAVDRLEEIWTEIEAGQGRLSFDPNAAKHPKKPHGSEDRAAAKSEVG
jgi:hypothetical protein